MAPGSGSHRILGVEDHEDLRTGVALFFGSGGYEVVEAANGIGILYTAITKHPKFILLDFRLPDMNEAKVVVTVLRNIIGDCTYSDYWMNC